MVALFGLLRRLLTQQLPMVPHDRVSAWLAEGRPLVLSDDYAPVDNLMAPMFAERGR